LSTSSAAGSTWLRIAALPDSSLIARRLCQVRRLVVGAPAYFDRRSRPTHPAELAEHDCLGYAYLPSPEIWRFVHIGGDEAAVTPRGPLRANNADALAPALLAGLGLAIQPEFTVWEDLAAGRLEQVLTEWSLPPIALHMVMPPGRTDVGEMIPLEGIIFTGPASSAPVEEYNAGALTGQRVSGAGTGPLTDSGSGDLVGVGFGWAFVVPSDYVSGDTLSDTSTYDNQTFSSLGATPGTYEWTWGSGANQSFTFDIEAVPVPLIGRGLRVLLAVGGLLFGASCWREPRDAGSHPANSGQSNSKKLTYGSFTTVRRRPGIGFGRGRQSRRPAHLPAALPRPATAFGAECALASMVRVLRVWDLAVDGLRAGGGSGRRYLCPAWRYRRRGARFGAARECRPSDWSSGRRSQYAGSRGFAEKRCSGHR
jgi:LysR substrate binding domain